jgi:hypothetical protein
MTTAASGSGKGRPPIPGRGFGSDSPGLLTRLRRDALQALAAGPLYRHTLMGRVPADLRLRIAQRWPGDAKRGAAIAGGEIELGAALVSALGGAAMARRMARLRMACRCCCGGRRRPRSNP